MRTGDLGMFVDGELYVTGRIVDLLTFDGRHHYPQDIEATAAGASALVRRRYAAAFSVRQRDGSERLVMVAERATGTAKSDPAPAIDAIRAAVLSRHGVQPTEILMLPAEPAARSTLTGHCGRKRSRDVQQSCPRLSQHRSRRSLRQPYPDHGTEMEGWFWRVSDAASGRALVALCSLNRHPAGDWSTAAVAVHPGLTVRAGALGGARSQDSPFSVSAGDEAGRFTVGTERISFELGDLRLNMSFHQPITWPKAFGGGGIFSAIPYLNQYWHPYYLGGKASGTVEYGDQSWTFTDAKLYAERNWGAGFPLRWWWGQAHDFGADDVCVAFSGGLLSLGRIARDVNGIVVRLGGKVIRMTPPVLVRSQVGDNQWMLRGRSPRYEIELEGDGRHLPPHVLPVPLPGERRNIDTDFEHLGGRLRCTVRERGRLLFNGTSEMAGLEVGTRPE